MKKTTTLLTFILFFAVTAFAGPVDPDKALEIANSFWKSNSLSGKKAVTLQLATENGMSKSGSRLNIEEGNAQYYIITPQEGNGFVIVSGEDRMSPIVGYSTANTADEMPPALADWLSLYSEYVDDVRTGKIEPAITKGATGPAIAPLLQTSWNQSAPYNNYCPSVNGQKTPTGCTATAMAQVMKFHEWPASPKKAITWYNNITGNTETIDITKNVYAWDNMLNHYRNGYTTKQADAVAQLMIDVGKAIGSVYAPSGTASNEVNTARALVNVFDYSPQIKVFKRNECTYEEFLSVIRENLEARQPLVHTGQAQSFAAGHAFVCDGIDENNYVHIDWGWDGAYNGYFDLGSMAPGGTGIGGGQDRYNVYQSIIANIRPRAADEADRSGDPSLYVYDVVDKNKENSVVDEYTAKFVSGTASFRVIAQFFNWSHSTVNMQCMLSITSADGKFNKMNTVSTAVEIPTDNAKGFYIDFYVNNSNTTNPNYLAEGTYYVEVYHKDANGNNVKMKGENNRLILEVGTTSVKLSKALPDISVSGFEFRDTSPIFPKDEISFDVALRNNNTNNALVVVVPIINRINGNKVVSDTLVDAGEILNVFDNTDFLVTYSLGSVLSAGGEHYVTFAYDMRNSYTNHEKKVDKSRLKSISGQSKTFTIYDISTTPMPIVAAVTSNSPNFGENLNLAVRILNNSSASAYNGTIGIFAEKDGVKTLMHQSKVEELSAGGTCIIQYSSANYIFNLDPGTYKVTVCELVDNEWAMITHNGDFSFVLQNPTKCILYANNRIDFNGGKNEVGRGDSIDIFTDIECRHGDFDGYVRMNVLNGISMVLRSNYIPVSMKDGESLNINLRSMCGKSAPFRDWKVNIVYYTKNKTQLGTVIVNDITYPDNGKFYVRETTAIDDVRDSSATITTAKGTISIDGAVGVKILGMDGRTIYCGTATTLNVGSGMYVVVTEDTDGIISAEKVLVK